MNHSGIYHKARDVAAAAAHQAGSLIQHHAGQLLDIDVREKGTHDLVTVVDEASQQLIIRLLTQTFPDFEVLAEEGRKEVASLVPDGFRWIIDPIDGTTNFLHGVPPYTVSIGLQHEEKMVVGVVLDVSRGDLYTAVLGEGAFRNGLRIHVSDTQKLDDSLLVTGFPYRVFDYLDDYLAVLAQFMRKTRGIRRTGSAAADLAYVACGKFDGFFETGLNAWDVAAGLLLVEEAGGRVTNYHATPSTPFDRQVVASNGAIHEAMREVLTPLQDIVH